jgi:capsular polysaccharide biosynthesis protein
VTGDNAHLSQLDSLIAVEQQRLNDLPTTGSQYAQLSSQRVAMQTEYEAVATRRANALANRAEASSSGSVVVLDRAIKADTQLAGGRTRAAFMSLLLVLAFALGAAFLVDYLDPRISRPEDIEQLYGIPVVSTFGAK